MRKRRKGGMLSTVRLKMKSNGQIGKVARVIGVTVKREVSLLMVDGQLVARLVSAEELSPIPLTPEILEQNGFHYNNPNELPIWDGWEQYGLLLYQSGKGYAINCGTNVAMEINAVNDLQHALKLCGIEKEIVV